MKDQVLVVADGVAGIWNLAVGPAEIDMRPKAGVAYFLVGVPSILSNNVEDGTTKGKGSK